MTSATSPQAARAESAAVPAWGHILIFFAAVAIALSRRPAVLLHAQFFAEGGTVFFADAYNHGLASLLMATPRAGYLQIFERLIALLACLFPLAAAPAITHFISLTVMALPVNLFLSSRYRFVGSVPVRAVAALVYLALPSTGEVFANVATIKAYMPILALLVIFAIPDRRTGWRIFDIAVLALFSVTGPTVVLLFPAIALLWWLRRQRWVMAALAPGAVAQGIVIITTMHKMRTHVTAPLGATPSLLLEILSRQVFLAPVLGVKTMPPTTGSGYLAFSVLTTLLGVATIINCALRAALELKLFLLCAAVLTTASLVFPLCSTTVPQWQVMVMPGACNRYWLIPMLAFLTSVAWMAWTQRSWQRGAAVIVLLIMLIGIRRDWRHGSYPDQHFARQARFFDQVPRGTVMSFAIEPPGWKMRLVKK